MRLALKQVEDALQDPAAWAKRLASGDESRGGNSRPGSLLHAIGKYHRHGEDAAFARKYLDGRLEKFRAGAANEEIRNQLDWYIDDWETRTQKGWLNTKLDLNVTVPQPLWVRDDFRCSGRVSRFDVDPSGGYAAWLMTQSRAADRLAGIEALIVQHAVADHLNVPTRDVKVGIYGFKDRFVGLICGTDVEVKEAMDDFWNLLRALKLAKTP